LGWLILRARFVSGEHSTIGFAHHARAQDARVPRANEPMKHQYLICLDAGTTNPRVWLLDDARVLRALRERRAFDDWVRASRARAS
jgi:hypothetical protein